jgi:4-amino-4-deoxy-L-arabinose transferase-like glycosyltransferase
MSASRVQFELSRRGIHDPSVASTASVAASSAEADRSFLIYLYFGALAIRLTVGMTILFGGYIDYFAGDHSTYDGFGWGLARAWAGQLQATKWVYDRMKLVGQNGMYYWIAILYTVFGHSQSIATAIQCSIVSFTPVLTFKISYLLYGSRKAARTAALLVAFLPSMVIWSSLLLKDPLIILLLCATVYSMLRIQKDLKYIYIIAATAAILPIMAIRIYVFYFILFAVVGGYLMSRFGSKASLAGYMARLAGIALLGITLFALGFDRISQEQFSVNLLEKIQTSRTDLSRAAYSGFGTEANVSTLSSAISFMPVGIMYLMLAPFPWQGGGFRYMLALPEQLIWYCLIPYFVIGLIYTARKHLRDALIIFLFTIQLTCFYGIFVGNVGTAHRQRTQVFVFYLIFTAAGMVYRKAKRQGRAGTIAD